MKRFTLLFFFLFNLFCSAQQTIGKIEKLDEEIDLLIDENTVIEILADGFNWLEASLDRAGLADGMKVHSKGYLFATGPGGVLIFSPVGKHLGSIITEKRTANCTFNKDESALYMTSDKYPTRIKLKH